MKRHWRTGSYVAVLVIMLSLGVAQPRVWATPAQSHANQTVPTPTPKGAKPPTAKPPTAVPPTAAAPTTAPATAVPATAAPAVPTSVIPPTLPVQTATPEVSSDVTLQVQADRTAIWPGVVVQITVTLRNEGTVSARYLTLTNRLPAELQPGPILPEGIAAWEDQQFIARTAVLPPGGTLSLRFSATVRSASAAGKIIQDEVTVVSDGGMSMAKTVLFALPPTELPAVGGQLPFACLHSAISPDR